MASLPKVDIDLKGSAELFQAAGRSEDTPEITDVPDWFAHYDVRDEGQAAGPEGKWRSWSLRN